MKNGFFILSMICVAVSAAAGLYMSATPLLNVVGYESGAALGVLAVVVSGLLGAAAGRASRAAEDAAGGRVYQVSLSYLRASGAGFAALAVAAAIIAVKTYFVDGCNIGPGISVFAWITVPTLLHMTAAGLFLGRVCAKRWTAALLFCAYFLLAAAATLAEFLLGQHQVVHNLVIGAFSMTGFNGWALVLPDSFYVYRVLIAFFATFFIGLALLLPRGGGLSKAAGLMGLRNVVVSLMVFLFCVIVVPDRTGFGSGRRTLDAELSETLDTGSAVIHYSPGAMSRFERRGAAAYTEWWLMQIRDALDMDQPWKVQIYLYRDSDEMERHTFARDFYFAQPWKHTLHIEKRSVATLIMKHELVHVMMGAYGGGIFGTPYNMGAVEGIAVAIEKDFQRGPKFQEIFAAALEADVIAPGTQTIGNTGFGSTSMRKSYDMAGGFVGFLLNRYGPDSYKSFYAGSGAAEAYGRSMAELNGEWFRWLGGIDVQPHVLRRVAYRYDDTAFPAFYKTRCPRVGERTDERADPYRRLHEMKMNEEYAVAAELCRENYEKSGDPEWLAGRARLLGELGEFDRMAAEAGKALESEKIKPATKARAFLLRARALAETGDMTSAADTLAALHHFGYYTPEFTETAIRIARRRKSGALMLSPFLQSSFPASAYMRILGNVAEIDPDFGIIYQQMALHLDRSSFSDTSSYLERFSELTTMFIRRTAGLDGSKYALLEKLGEAYLDAGNFDAARDTFKRMYGYAAGEREEYRAGELIERTQFFRDYFTRRSGKVKKSVRIRPGVGARDLRMK